MYQHNLQTLQTLVLLIYAMNHANIPSWALIGLTWNIAVRIGCHIDPSQLSLEFIESEERRRCWAALMMLYTVQNTCLGNTAPQVVTADVDLPVDIDDDKLSNYEPIRTADKAHGTVKNVIHFIQISVIQDRGGNLPVCCGRRPCRSHYHAHLGPEARN